MKANLCMLDRIIRAAAGAALVATAFYVGRLPGVALGVVGALLLLSAAVGFCHVYSVLRIRTLKRD